MLRPYLRIRPAWCWQMRLQGREVGGRESVSRSRSRRVLLHAPAPDPAARRAPRSVTSSAHSFCARRQVPGRRPAHAERSRSPSGPAAVSTRRDGPTAFSTSHVLAAASAGRPRVDEVDVPAARALAVLARAAGGKESESARSSSAPAVFKRKQGALGIPHVCVSHGE